MTCEFYILATGLPMGMEIWDVLLSIGLFVSVLLLVLSVFSQPGDIQVSPERLAAIATGHTDRRTVFEYPILRPIMWLLLTVAHRLAMPKTKNWLRRTLIAAGSPNYYTPEEFLAVCLGLGLAFGGLLQVFNLAVYGQFSVLLLVFGIAAGLMLALLNLHDTATKRTQEISHRLPYALDLIALAMGAGATFVEAVGTVVRERSENPFNVEFKTMLAEMDLGTTRRGALENLSARVPLESLRSIVASIIQAEELGSPLGQVLHDQATLLRLRRSFAAENKAAVASIRILLPCLLLVFAVMLAIFGPAIIRIVRGGLL